MITTMPTDTLIDSQPFYLWDTAYWVPETTEVNVGVPLDSVFPAVEHPAPLVRRSLFAGHTLEPQHDGLMARQYEAAPTWLFVILLALGGMTYLYFNMRKIKMHDLLVTTVDHRVLDRIVRVNNLSPMRLMGIGLLVSSLVAVAMCHVAGWGFGLWVALSLGLSLAYMFRWGLLRLIGRVFDEEESMNFYIDSSYLYHLVLSVALVPLLLLAVYSPWGGNVALAMAGGLVVLCFLMRLIRGVKLFLTISKAPSFYLFYYLCAVEMIPILVLLKVYLSQ